MYWLDVDVAGSAMDKEDLRREVTGQSLWCYYRLVMYWSPHAYAALFFTVCIIREKV